MAVKVRQAIEVLGFFADRYLALEALA